MVARAGVERARVDLVVDPSERNVGLTVNEYETLLMQNDLVDVLRDPLRFAKIKGRNMMNDPFAIPGKTLNYAKYDVVHVLNSLMEALRLDQGSFERLVAKVMSLPARRFLRSRRVSFLAGSDRDTQRAGPAARHLPEPDPGAVAACGKAGAPHRHRHRPVFVGTRLKPGAVYFSPTTTAKLSFRQVTSTEKPASLSNSSSRSSVK